MFFGAPLRGDLELRQAITAVDLNCERAEKAGGRRLLKYWGGSHVEAEGGMAGSRGRRIPVPQLRGQLPFCLAPATVALILALAGVARWAEIAADIGAALRALANAKIHSNRRRREAEGQLAASLGRYSPLRGCASLAPCYPPFCLYARPTPVFQQSPSAP